MSNTEDRRVRMTKKILKESLIGLMKVKPIHEISIKKICEEADINRSTFYHHYQSPQELYDDIIRDISEEICLIIKKCQENKATHSKILAELLSYIQENRELFLVILSDKGNIAIGEKLTAIVQQVLGSDTNNELSLYCAQFISAGLAHTLWLWLNKEDRLPPKDVAGLIVTILAHGVSRAVVFSNREGFNIK